MRLRALFLSFALGLSLLVTPIAHAKAPVPGATCSKLNASQVFNGKRFTCVKSGKKLVWNKGVTIRVTATPTPTVSQSIASSTSPTPTPSISESTIPTPTPTPSASPTPTPSASPTPKVTPTPSATPTATTRSLTLSEVKLHNNDKDCWTIIEGNVYDLTKWVYSHPGGSGAIRTICGVDGTQAFLNQHQGRREPIQQLQKYLLGPLTK